MCFGGIIGVFGLIRCIGMFVYIIPIKIKTTPNSAMFLLSVQRVGVVVEGDVLATLVINARHSFAVEADKVLFSCLYSNLQH